MKYDIHILSCIMKEPMHGYEIKKSIDAFMRSKKTSNSVLYPRLKKMESDGYIVGKIVEQPRKPNRTVYSITNKGKKYFYQSMNKVTPLSFKVQGEFYLRIYYFDLIEPKIREKLLESRLAFIKDGIDILLGNIKFDEHRSIYASMSNKYTTELLELEFKFAKDCMEHINDLHIVPDYVKSTDDAI